MEMLSVFSFKLKIEAIFITGVIAVGQYDIFRCSHRWKIDQNDEISVTMLILKWFHVPTDPNVQPSSATTIIGAARLCPSYW